MARNRYYDEQKHLKWLYDNVIWYKSRVYYDEDRKRYCRQAINNTKYQKFIKRYIQKKTRKYKDEITNGSLYRKIESYVNKIY